DVLPQLRERRRADDRCADMPAAADVAERELHEGEAVALRERGVRLDRLVYERLLEAHAEAFEARVARTVGPRAAEVFAGEHAAGERAVGEQRHAFAMQRLREIAVGRPRHEVVA